MRTMQANADADLRRHGKPGKTRTGGPDSRCRCRTRSRKPGRSMPVPSRCRTEWHVPKTGPWRDQCRTMPRQGHARAGATRKGGRAGGGEPGDPEPRWAKRQAADIPAGVAGPLRAWGQHRGARHAQWCTEGHDTAPGQAGRSAPCNRGCTESVARQGRSGTREPLPAVRPTERREAAEGVAGLPGGQRPQAEAAVQRGARRAPLGKRGARGGGKSPPTKPLNANGGGARTMDSALAAKGQRSRGVGRAEAATKQRCRVDSEEERARRRRQDTFPHSEASRAPGQRGALTRSSATSRGEGAVKWRRARRE